MSIHWSRMPYDQKLLPNLTQATSEELQVGSDNDDKAIRGKLAECKRCKVKAQEEAQLAEEAWLEGERQEQAWLKEERKAEVSQWADALVGSLTGARSNVEVMNPCCLHCTWTNTTCLHNTNGKKKCLACNQCNKLKEHCWWLVEGEAGSGVRLAGDKGKRKANWPSAKVLKGAGDEDEDVGKGPSMKKAGEETGAGPITSDQMECLIKVVEHVADNMVGLTVAQQEVSRNFYRFARSYEMYIEEHFEFLVPDMPSDRDTTNEDDWDAKGLNEELDGLREEEEESQSWSESGDQAGAGSTGSQV
ncbi:hypothetical protein M404DRAFT_33148 [Pisolithus tinctorius Marx 270]|uniref:Uncharacterized protein n=1 Tax=Pisolithus tinctorius Marx 270 TaxID=870435 RepID=A0A0C3NLN0_PISTI|nr:hypothetical protein M404DRAFT_33148 [Pisolithus tinctorius Marx 270]